MSIVFDLPKSETAEQLAQIIQALQQHPEIEQALLSTDDGIPVQLLAEQDGRLGAVSGFILAAARQGFAMLNLCKAREISIQDDQGRLFVSQIFQVSESWLVLTIILKREAPYKQLFKQAISTIMNTVEK